MIALFRHLNVELSLASIRASVCIGLPMMASLLTGDRDLWLLVALGALWGVSQDGVDSWRGRLSRIARVALVSGLGIGLGTTYSGLGTWYSLIAIALAALIGGYLEGFPRWEAPGMHLLLGVIVGSGLGLPVTPWLAGGAVFAGCITVLFAAWLSAMIVTRTIGYESASSVESDTALTGSSVVRSLWGAEKLPFAVLLTIATVIGAEVAMAIGGPRAYWLPVSVAFIFRRDLGPVWSRGAARSIGTLAAAALIAALGPLVHSGVPLVVIAICAAAILPIATRANHAAAVLTFTPIVFAILGAIGQQSDLLLPRIVDTAIAAAIVFVIDLVPYSKIRAGNARRCARNPWRPAAAFRTTQELGGTMRGVATANIDPSLEETP